MTRVLYVDCVAGVAGDMLLGALLDAGADPEAIRVGLTGLDVAGLELRMERVSRHALAATHATIHGAPGQPRRDWRSIRAQIEAAALPAGRASGRRRPSGGSRTRRGGSMGSIPSTCTSTRWARSMRSVRCAA